MQATDRAGYVKLAEALFAAFDKPASEGRMEAYWRGLRGMDLLAFERVVEAVIGPQGEDELPTPKQLYAIDRKRRAQIRADELASRTPQPAPGQPEPDRFTCYANRVLLAVLCSLTSQRNSAATAESLAAMVHVKQNFADKYREQCITDPDASLELRDHLIGALTPLFVPCDVKTVCNAPASGPAGGEGLQRVLADIAAANAVL